MFSLNRIHNASEWWLCGQCKRENVNVNVNLKNKLIKGTLNDMRHSLQGHLTKLKLIHYTLVNTRQLSSETFAKNSK